MQNVSTTTKHLQRKHQSCALHQTVQLSVNSLDEEGCISQSVTSTVHYDIKTLFLLLERG